MNFRALAGRCVRATPSRLHVVLPLSIMGVLYWLSSIPGLPLPDDPALHAIVHWVPPSVQKALHVLAYAVLAWVWWRVLGAWLHVPVARTICAFAITSTYGALDEWHQSFVPERYASLTDVALDAAGAMLGIWLATSKGSRARSIKSPMNTDTHG